MEVAAAHMVEVVDIREVVVGASKLSANDIKVSEAKGKDFNAMRRKRDKEQRRMALLFLVGDFGALRSARYRRRLARNRHVMNARIDRN